MRRRANSATLQAMPIRKPTKPTITQAPQPPQPQQKQPQKDKKGSRVCACCSVCRKSIFRQTGRLRESMQEAAFSTVAVYRYCEREKRRLICNIIIIKYILTIPVSYMFHQLLYLFNKNPFSFANVLATLSTV